MLARKRGMVLSKKSKHLQAVRNNPKNVRFETLQRIMLDSEFSETTPSGGSSHYTYSKGTIGLLFLKIIL
jgi:hypothetical protein